MTELTIIKEPGTCQVRSGTARPCARPAAVKLQGIPFCESCAREQEAYFAIGEFTEAGVGRGGTESLATVMDLMKKLRLRRQGVRDHGQGRAVLAASWGSGLYCGIGYETKPRAGAKEAPKRDTSELPLITGCSI